MQGKLKMVMLFAYILKPNETSMSYAFNHWFNWMTNVSFLLMLDVWFGVFQVLCIENFVGQKLQ
jgi:hypothetical protein